MKELLVVVDMQKDFVDGALANPNAQAIVPAVTEFVKNWKGDIVFTRDTHEADYMDTLKWKNLKDTHSINRTNFTQDINHIKP